MYLPSYKATNEVCTDNAKYVFCKIGHGYQKKGSTQCVLSKPCVLEDACAVEQTKSEKTEKDRLPRASAFCAEAGQWHKKKTSPEKASGKAEKMHKSSTEICKNRKSYGTK